MARSRPTPRAARRRRHAGRRGARSRSAGSASAGARWHPGRCWWRSGRARSAASCGPRTCRGCARRGPAPPGGRPRRPARSRASGSSAHGARSGGARSAGRRRPRCPSGRSRAALSAPQSTLSVWGSSRLMESRRTQPSIWNSSLRSTSHQPMNFRARGSVYLAGNEFALSQPCDSPRAPHRRSGGGGLVLPRALRLAAGAHPCRDRLLPRPRNGRPGWGRGGGVRRGAVALAALRRGSGRRRRRPIALATSAARCCWGLVRARMASAAWSRHPMAARSRSGSRRTESGRTNLLKGGGGSR